MGNALNTNLTWIVNVLSAEPEMFEQAQRGAWNDLILRVANHPQETSWRDRCGNTALHLICRKQPPADIVAALVRVYKEAVTMQTNDGMTPLHFACYCGASYGVVKLLIEANRSVINIADKRGRTALLCLVLGCKNSDSHQIIREMLKLNPALSCIADQKGRNPLVLVLDDYADAIENQINIVVAENSSRRNSSDNNSVQSQMTETYMDELDHGWSCVMMLVKTAYHGTLDISESDDPFLLLHACVGIPYCPPRFVFLAIELWPHQLQETDSNGNLPLHIAASCPLQRRKHSRFNTLIKVLSKYPEGARVPDSSGVLPLQIAFESGKRWKDGIKDILGAYPEAVATLETSSSQIIEILSLAGQNLPFEVLLRILQSKPDILCSP